MRPLLRDLFEEITLWSVKADSARAGIDPYRTLIGRERDDNVTGVTIPDAPRP